MLLHFLGAGCAYRPQWGNTSALGTFGGQTLLLDCGENIFTRLYETGLLETCGKMTVLITHIHADHVGSLSTLISYMRYEKQNPIRVCFPGDQVERLMKTCGISDGECLFDNRPAGTLENGVSYRAIPVEHAANLSCYGYQVTAPEGCFYYSGDARTLPSQVLADFQAGRIQELYQDATFLQPQGQSHGSLEALCQAIAPRQRQRVCPMHFYDVTPKDAAARGFAIPDCFEGRNP